MKLYQIIVEKIKKQGSLPFDEFMEMALYYPKLGYYNKPDIKIGKSGDFFTASHLGSVFGLLLSKEIEKLWYKLKCSRKFTITEIGPGIGYLAKDILDNCNCCFKYNLVEINPKLAKIQTNILKKHITKTSSYSSIDEIKPFQGVIICNEVFDALPVRIFEIRNGVLREVYVTINEKNEIIEEYGPARDETFQYLKQFAPWVFEFKIYRSEVNIIMKQLIEKLSKILEKGFVLIFDYGWNAEEYYHPNRNRGTLLCYYKHTINENPYINIGEQDITAHVNFTALNKWSKEAEFNIEGYFSQGKFLYSLCDEEVLKELQNKDLIQAFKRLVLPQGMGESHRVMILSKL